MREQIKNGKELQRYIILPSTQEAFEQETKYDQWSEFNTAMLTHSLNDDYFLNEYARLPIETPQSQSGLDRCKAVRSNAQIRVAKLESILGQLRLIPLSTSQAAKAEAPRPGFERASSETVPPLGVNRYVFIVHGHDHGTKNTIARFVEGLGASVTILHEKPDRGMTLIEKIEQHADVGSVLVLLTPDDVGGLNIEHPKLAPRARQNVVFELGFFVGWLGRSKVTVLHAEGVEIPTDYQGVVYIPLDATDAWKLKLARELRAAGIPINMNKIV